MRINYIRKKLKTRNASDREDEAYFDGGATPLMHVHNADGGEEGSKPNEGKGRRIAAAQTEGREEQMRQRKWKLQCWCTVRVKWCLVHQNLLN